MSRKQPISEPHKIKTVRRIAFPSIEERKRNLASAAFNVWRLTPSQVTFDMCSAGTSALSQEQLAGQLIGDEAYAGARNFESLQLAVRDVFGHSYVCPTHNNLGSVKLVVATMVPSGKTIPSNARTRADVLEPRGVQVPDIRDRDEKVFTGNVDLKKLEQLIEKGNVALVGMQATLPFSISC